MARRHVVILFIVVIGVFALVWSKKGGHQPSISDSLQEAAGVIESSDPQSEEEISYRASDSQEQITEIPSHGVNAAAESRRLLEPRWKIQPRLNPDERNLAQASILSGTSWKLWHGVVAYPQSSGARTSFLAEVSGYYLVQDESFKADERLFSNSQPLVVFNERKGFAGVITGTIQLTLHEGASIEALVGQYGLKLLNSFPQTKTYFVTSAVEPYDLLSLKERLSSDAGVSQVELEILSRKYEKY